MMYRPMAMIPQIIPCATAPGIALSRVAKFTVLSSRQHCGKRRLHGLLSLESKSLLDCYVIFGDGHVQQAAQLGVVLLGNVGSELDFHGGHISAVDEDRRKMKAIP